MKLHKHGGGCNFCIIREVRLEYKKILYSSGVIGFLMKEKDFDLNYRFFELFRIILTDITLLFLFNINNVNFLCWNVVKTRVKVFGEI